MISASTSALHALGDISMKKYIHVCLHYINGKRQAMHTLNIYYNNIYIYDNDNIHLLNDTGFYALLQNVVLSELASGVAT